MVAVMLPPAGRLWQPKRGHEPALSGFEWRLWFGPAINGRSASSAAPVQRAELSAPSPVASRDPATRREAMAQPFPSATANGAPSMASARLPANNSADTLSTGSVKRDNNGWHTEGASSVTLNSGETRRNALQTLRRAGKGNPAGKWLKSASAARPGQSIVIPRFGQTPNAARAASNNIDFSKNNAPAPTRGQEQNLAVLRHRALLATRFRLRTAS